MADEEEHDEVGTGVGGDGKGEEVWEVRGRGHDVGQGTQEEQTTQRREKLEGERAINPGMKSGWGHGGRKWVGP